MPLCVYVYIFRTMRFAYHSFRLYIGFHSIVVAICRICFIVYEQHILNYGIEKFRKIIYYGSVLVPLAIAILAEGTIPNYEQNDTFFAIMATRCAGDTTNVNDTNLEIQSPIYAFVQNNISSYITISIKGFSYAMVFIILSNTIEGIIYWYTWSTIKR